ncbi:MAG: hypothetical protein J3Q66DRAFT_404151 [Benniella sp.]|nr:MAG: hypothetical protein J3Q66DRAFT_404151 [Benniella sp.]
MGVQDLYDQLKKLGLLPLSIDTRFINGDIHIDLFGTYYLKVQNHLAEKLPNVEKAEEHKQRVKDYEALKDRLDRNLDRIEERSSIGKWTVETIFDDIKKTLPGLFRLTPNDKAGLAQRNDYNANVQGFGIVKSLEIVQKIPIATFDKMLTNYCKTASTRIGERVSTDQFEKSKRHLHKTHGEHGFRSKHRNQQSIYATQDNENTCYIGKNKKPNQFKNVFESRDVMLRGRTIDLSKVKEHGHSPPRKKVEHTPEHATVRKTVIQKKQAGVLPKRARTDGDKKKWSNATKKDRRLKKLHPTRTLKVGSIECNVERFLKGLKDDADSNGVSELNDMELDDTELDDVESDEDTEEAESDSEEETNMPQRTLTTMAAYLTYMATW